MKTRKWKASTTGTTEQIIQFTSSWSLARVHYLV